MTQSTSPPFSRRLPARAEMLRAVAERDRSFEGVFLLGVRTTGIFCRPGCPARSPRPENIVFFADAREALADGFRPCKRCRPLEQLGSAPSWLRPLLEAVEADPTRRWRDADLRARELSPARVRRWFQQTHGMSFHAYSRARRLGAAFDALRGGVTAPAAGLDAGFESASGFAEAFRKLSGQTPRRGARATRVDVDRVPSPLGPLLVGAAGEQLVLLEFTDRRGLPGQLKTLARRLDAVWVPGSTAVIREATAQLDAWFAGDRDELELPFSAPGTPFQESVWRALRQIPRGETRSYGQLARQLGRPSATRAVAAANGANRLAILIPCHRVIGADGKLTGYGGGLWRKQRLLEIEGLALPLQATR